LKVLISFRPTCFGASHGHPDRVRFSKSNLKTERVATAYRLLFVYAFVRPQSEQNGSHLQIEERQAPGTN
jgi:hypothetical protein